MEKTSRSQLAADFVGLSINDKLGLEPTRRERQPQPASDQVSLDRVCQEYTRAGQCNNCNDEMKHNIVLDTGHASVRSLNAFLFQDCFVPAKNGFFGFRGLFYGPL
jgi:hypothetical protein